MRTRGDQELLRDYAERGSETAFSELARRYVDFVYSAALRMVRNPQLAEDVTQAVFVALSQNIRCLADRPVLVGWLHRTTQNLAAKAVRSEVRRRVREQEAAAMNQLSSSETESAWEQMSPHLDAVLGTLKGTDRDVVLLRYFQRKSAREIAEALDLSEAAAQKRVARALERLRGAFAARGVTVSAGLMISVLAAHSVQAAPTGLAALASASAAGSASSTAGLLNSWLKFMAMTKVQATTVGLLFVAGVATPLLLNSRAGGEADEGGGGERAKQRVASSLRNTEPRLRGGGAPLQGSPALARLETWLPEVDSDSKASRIDVPLRAMIWSLAPKDYALAWDLRGRIQSRRLQQKYMGMLLHFWAKSNPRAALAAAQSVAKREASVDDVFWSWADTEPAAALGWARELPDEKRRVTLSLVAIEAMAGNDPGGAMAALQELPAGLSRERASFRVLERWAEHEPAAAARYVAELPASSQRSRAFGAVTAWWAVSEPKALLEWAQTLPDNRERVSAVAQALTGVARDSPAEAAGMLKAFASTFAENPGAADNCLHTLVGSWAKSDLPAAVEWVKQLPDGVSRRAVMPRLVEQWRQQDPRGAAEFVAVLPAGENQNFLLQGVLSEWCRKDLKAAMAWAQSQSSAPVRESALAAVYGRLAGSDGVMAANLVASLPPGDLQSKAAVSVAGGWAIQDPKAALAWAEQFPEEQLRAQATAAVVSRWAWDDIAAASRWLETLPDGSVRQQTATAYVRAVMFSNPERAARWVSVIAEGRERNKLMEMIGRQWLYTDAEPARQWLMQTTLPEEKKKQLLEGR